MKVFEMKVAILVIAIILTIIAIIVRYSVANEFITAYAPITGRRKWFLLSKVFMSDSLTVICWLVYFIKVKGI